MTTNALDDRKTAAAPAVETPVLQQFYWSVRRELWENRSIYLAPAAVGLLIVLASAVSAFQLPGRLAVLDPAQQHAIIEQPYMFASLLLMLSAVLVALYYCLEAFQSERRDRSILFWRSMPVSDLTTVAAKASIPVLALPLVTFGVTVVTHILMFLLGSLRLSQTAEPLSAHVPLMQMWPLLFHHLIVGHGLWYAPMYGWLLLVSAWARRAPLLWATLPLLVLALVEKIAFNTSYFAALLASRFVGSPATGRPEMNPMVMDSLVPASAGDFLTSPAFWGGLAFLSLCLAGAVWLRRQRAGS
jgi:ABC-2 type transport system permease protein